VTLGLELASGVVEDEIRETHQSQEVNGTLSSVHIFNSANHSGDEIIGNGSDVIETYDGTWEDRIEL